MSEASYENRVLPQLRLGSATGLAAGLALGAFLNGADNSAEIQGLVEDRTVAQTSFDAYVDDTAGCEGDVLRLFADNGDGYFIGEPEVVQDSLRRVCGTESAIAGGIADEASKRRNAVMDLQAEINQAFNESNYSLAEGLYWGSFGAVVGLASGMGYGLRRETKESEARQQAKQQEVDEVRAAVSGAVDALHRQCNRNKATIDIAQSDPTLN